VVGDCTKTKRNKSCKKEKEEEEEEEEEEEGSRSSLLWVTDLIERSQKTYN
jgi:ribosomal protein L12E/L44/L45/RPP1/RPP2